MRCLWTKCVFIDYFPKVGAVQFCSWVGSGWVWVWVLWLSMWGLQGHSLLDVGCSPKKKEKRNILGRIHPLTVHEASQLELLLNGSQSRGTKCRTVCNSNTVHLTLVHVTVFLHWEYLPSISCKSYLPCQTLHSNARKAPLLYSMTSLLFSPLLRQIPATRLNHPLQLPRITAPTPNWW